MRRAAWPAPHRSSALLDQDGRALDPALAQRVAAVYSALDTDDLESIRRDRSLTGVTGWAGVAAAGWNVVVGAERQGDC